MSDDIVDTPVHRMTFDEATIAQQEALLESIRSRRLHVYQAYAELQSAKQEARNAKLIEKANKLATRIAKKLVTVDKGISDLEALLLSVKATKMELEHE